MDSHLRDHLFISYAWEDAVFAEWLALRLTAEGYKIWCDRLKLLGGESYPQDIDQAIKEQTYRVLGLISKHSLHKPNPLKERTLALNLGREWGEEFLIPLNVDGLRATDLTWMLSDLTYIPFHSSWANGLMQLLTKLNSIDAPRSLATGRQAVVDWFAARDSVKNAPERLWTNLLEIVELPRNLLRINLNGPVPSHVAPVWPHYAESETVVWAFEGPGRSDGLDILDLEEVVWAQPFEATGLKLADVVTNLLKQHLRVHCLQKGMQETSQGQHLYFPPDLLPNNRLSFVTYSGSRTWVRTVGERTFRVANGEREKTRYHLSPTFRPNLWKYQRPVIQVQNRVYLTDTEGRPLQARKALRRRKKICKDWWNYEWLARVFGVASWLADGAESVNVLGAGDSRVILSGRPIHLEAPVGIDESIFAAAIAVDEDEAELSDDEWNAFDSDSDLDEDRA